MHGKRMVRTCGLAIIFLLCILLVWALMGRRGTRDALTTTFVGYTNTAGSSLRFALFCASNSASHSIRWRGFWVEIEGSPNHKAPIMNPSLPGFSYAPVLKARQTLQFAIGEPAADEPGRWRFVTSFSRYTLGARWLDFSYRYKLPWWVNRIVPVDQQRILNPSNNVESATVWLAK